MSLPSAQPSSWRFEAIGTSWEIVTAAPLGADRRAAVSALIERFDAEWSRFRADSVVSGLGASLERLGYDPAYTLSAGAPVAAPAGWTSLLTWDDGILSLAAPAVIDVGALGKGRLVDLVLDLVHADGAGDVVIDAGGDLAVRGAPQRVGLEHPFDPSRAIGVWEVTDAALCASAVNRRAWGDGLHPVLDARTGVPVRTIAATWAVAADAMTADAIATALFFDGGPRLAHDGGVEWVRMTTDGAVQWSPGCRADLFVRAASVES
jgi:thiamine biosynthesis lipoprotein